MNKHWMVAGVVAALLVIPVMAHAHEGHAHKVMGTVSSIEGNHVIVKATDGKTINVMLDTETKITRGKTKLGAADVKVGDRVVAEGSEEKDMLMAASVQLGTAAPTAAKR